MLCTSLLAAAPPGAAATTGGADGKGFIPRQADAPAGQKRVALIIGNGAYTQGALRNPTRDAKAMAEALSSIGFDVDARFDLDRAGMLRALRRFADRLDKDSVALFYYSGHGITHGGRSFMLPVATDIRTAADVEIEGVDLRRVTARLEEVGSRLNLVILDACRNNPQIYAGQRSSSGGGLAFTTAPTGTLIAYATAPGQTAADGRGRLSPYTKALVQELRVPGRPVEEVFKAVRRRVRRASQGTQVPWESSSLEGRFVFVPEGWTPTPIAPDEASPFQDGALAAAFDQATEQEPKLPPRRRVAGAVDDPPDEPEPPAASPQVTRDDKDEKKNKKRRRLSASEQAAKRHAARVERQWRASKTDALKKEEAELTNEIGLFGLGAAGTGAFTAVSFLVSGAGLVILSTPSDPGTFVTNGAPNALGCLWVGASCGGCLAFVGAGVSTAVLAWFAYDRWRGARAARRQRQALAANKAPPAASDALAMAF